MKLILIFVAMMTLATFVRNTSSHVSDSMTAAQRRDIHEVARYRMFAYTTALYLQANPGYSGTLTWADLSGAASTPPAMRAGRMPTNLKAVVASASDYVICGELSEQAATGLAQLLPEQARAYRTTSGNGVAFTTSSAAADLEYAKCL